MDIVKFILTGILRRLQENEERAIIAMLNTKEKYEEDLVLGLAGVEPLEKAMENEHFGKAKEETDNG